MLLALWFDFWDWDGVREPTVGDGKYLPDDYYTRKANAEYQKAKERQKIKEEEVIRLRLEAQDTLLQKRELQASRANRDKIRLQKLEAQHEALLLEIKYQLEQLSKLQEIFEKKRNNLIMILLQCACPFTRITIH